MMIRVSAHFTFLLLSFIIGLWSTPQHLFSQNPSRPLTITIICRDNGVGLSKDAAILSEELLRLGHTVKWVLPSREKLNHSSDINIFIEHIIPKYLNYAKKNYFIPNPEWYTEPISLLSKCDLILCRTRDCVEIFGPLHRNVYFLNFTSKDCLKTDVEKDYYSPLHSIGKSQLKGTEAVLAVWDNNKAFPPLTFIQGKKMFTANSENVIEIDEYLEEAEYQQMQNHHGLHLCASSSEGFGHYILEAMSTGAVVITTDAPPMNEYVRDKRLLVRVCGCKKRYLGYKYQIETEHLEEVTHNALSFSREEMERIGRRNRKFFLQQKEDFKKRLRELFGAVTAPMDSRRYFLQYECSDPNGDGLLLDSQTVIRSPNLIVSRCNSDHIGR